MYRERISEHNLFKAQPPRVPSQSRTFSSYVQLRARLPSNIQYMAFFSAMASPEESPDERSAEATISCALTRGPK